MSDLPVITRIDFMPRERAILSRVMQVTGQFILALRGFKKKEDYDIEAINYLLARPDEMAELMMKVNRDVVSEQDAAEFNALRGVEDAIVKLRVMAMKNTLEDIARNHPHAKSRMKEDMMWLCNELLSRLQT